jgi:tetratricopeptide (TPR) repeat protein
MKIALLSLSLFVLLALAPQDPKATLTLTTVGGESVSAQVLEQKGDTARLKVFILGGNMTVTRKLSDFAPLSVFRIEMAARPPADFDSHFAMAKRAADLRLLTQAGYQARAAVESVKDATEQATKRKDVRAWAADTLESFVRSAIGDNRVADARHALKLLSTRLPELRTEEQLDALAGEVAAIEDRAVGERDAARNAKRDAQAREKMTKTLGQVREHLAKGDKAAREAIRKSGSTTQSTNLCEKAIDAYKAGWKKLQDVIEKAGDDPVLAEDASELGQQLHDRGIRAALHAANMLTVQSDYKGAMDWANRILAFDPDNAEAKEMQRTIQIAAAAASSDWGWGWSTVGGSGPVVDPRKQ